MNITVNSGIESHVFSVPPDATVRNLKELIPKTFGIKYSEQRLVFGNIQLSDEKRFLRGYGVTDESVVDLIIIFRESRTYSVCSLEIRKAICRALECQMSLKVVAHVFEKPYSTISGIYRKYLSTGTVEMKKRGGLTKSKLCTDDEMYIQELIQNDCTISLRSIRDKLRCNRNIEVSQSTIASCLKRMKITRKRINKVAIKSVSAGVENMRTKYCNVFQNLLDQQKVLIFYDESIFQFGTYNGYGRSAKGTRAVKMFPTLQMTTIKIMATICNKGFLYYIAQRANINSQEVYKYFSKFLEVLEDDGITDAAIIMDNAAFHKTPEIQELISDHGHQLVYLPPYSPFFNPIENVFSQWKGFVKRDNPDSLLEFVARIHDFKDEIDLENIQNYFRHAENNVNKYMSGVPAPNL